MKTLKTIDSFQSLLSGMIGVFSIRYFIDRLRFIDPMPLFEKEEMPETVQPGWAEIVCDDGANVRNEPGGIWRTWFPKGVRVHKTGECQSANGLQWEKIDAGYWIARADSDGTVMLKDLE